MSLGRRLVVVPLCLMLLAACGGASPNPSAVAAAKCGLPISQRLLPSEDQRVVTKRVTVRDLSGGRRQVTGIALTEGGAEGEDGGREREFTCVVAPDAADTLRGLRLESLDVPGSLDAWRAASPEVVVRSYVDALSVGDLELARSLSTSTHVRRVQGQTDSWYSNVVYISDLALLPPRQEGRDVFVPVTFTLQQRRALSMPNGSTTWGYRLTRTTGRWLIADEGPL
jgi:hypothetical protein